MGELRTRGQHQTATVFAATRPPLVWCPDPSRYKAHAQMHARAREGEKGLVISKGLGICVKWVRLQ